MSTPPRRAVFTGLGLLSPLGSDPATVWRNLCAGTPGVRPVSGFDTSALPCQLFADLPDFDPKKIVPKEWRKNLNKMARTVQLGFCAAALAWEYARGPVKGSIDPFRFGVSFGCVMVSTDLEDIARGSKLSTNCTPGSVSLKDWGEIGLPEVPPQWMLKYLPNMPACHAAILLDAQGPSNSITTDDVAGLLALGEAYRIVHRGVADAMLVGGCESKTGPLGLARHNTFSPLTRRNDLGPAAVRPFGAGRDGTVLGEAAAAVLLEEESFAVARGATILGELVGFASGFDRGRSGTVFAGVIRNALTAAGITPADVDHVNAAAGGFVDLDAWEATAIHSVFGPELPVFAMKGHVGNTGAAAGVLELVASLLALRHGELPGTINAANRDSICRVAVHTGNPRPTTKPYAVKLSYTEMGQCAAAVVKKWD